MKSMYATAALAALLGFFSGAGASAQLPAGSAVSTDGFPIDVNAKPSTVQPGGIVTIKGTTVASPNGGKVVIRITRSGATPFSLTSTPAGDGTYTVTFSQTTSAGQYQVEAAAPDGKGRATTTFKVVAPAEIPATIASEAEQLIASVEKSLDVAREGLAAQPLSPAKQQAETRLAKAEAELAKAPAQIGVMKQQMTKVFEARSKVKEPMPDWDEYVGKLDTWKDDAESARKRLDQQAAATRAGAKGCAELDQYYEMLTAASDALKLAKTPVDLSLGFWKSKAIDGIANRTTDPRDYSKGEKFAYVQAMKLGVAALEGPAGILKAIPGFVLDAAKYLHQELFAMYCDKFEGPVQGVFVGESYTVSGELFIHYTIKLDGKMVLMHPRNVPANKPVAVEGYIEGNGQFQVGDNPNVIGRLIPGVALFHKVVSPGGIGYWNDFGQGLKGLAPNYFRVPLRGVLSADSIVLRMPMQAAVTDFGESIKGRTIWVVIPLGSIIPEVLDSPFPLQKAHPIIERVVRRRPVLKLSTSNGFVIAQGKFSRDTVNADRTAHVTTTLTLKACRPQCVPAGLYKGAP
jgi:hypothetical protein